MPKNLTPENRWETEFQVPLPGEPRNIGPLETLFQRLLNRTERLKNRIGAILGLSWDATPPDTLAGLAGRVGTLESNQGGTTLAAHRTNPVLDHPDGSVTSVKIADGAVTLPKLASVSADLTPNTLALRNAQGAVQDGAVESGFIVRKVNGLYTGGLGNKWVRLVQWTGFQGVLRGLFADLYISRVATAGMGARLRVRILTDESGNISTPLISLANDLSPTATVLNAILLQADEATYELWVQLYWLAVYVSGLVHIETGNITLTPYGNVAPIAQDSPPTPIPGGFYLEWHDAVVSQTFTGPGYIVAAARSNTSGYIRYDNGIQVVWGTPNIGSGTWAFPAAFASPPRVVATAEATAPRLVTIASVSATGVSLLRTDLSGNTTSGNVHVWGIGLWK